MSEKNINVLLIEDNPGDARLIQEMLAEARGVTLNVQHAGSLSKGLEHINCNDIELALLDLSLPDSHGLDTFIKVQSNATDIPIIVLSGLDNEELAVEAVQRGAQDYLVKGKVDSDLLVRAIRYAIERKASEYLIRGALKEKEVLLKEVHHRVKNNLQVISSLLKLQSQQIKDEETLEMFNDSRNRVRSMALIHEKLYRSKDLASIDLNGYIQDLIGGLFQSYGVRSKNIILKKDVERIALGVETAIPCGLIINELISNALKHAFPGDRKGEINITLQRLDDDKIKLTVSDNGIGIPEKIDMGNIESLGLRLVRILSEDQLKGKLNLDRTNGTLFQIEFGGLR
jgi:two-component sensor histidine kinase/CheY-like chemotaxis protein